MAALVDVADPEAPQKLARWAEWPWVKGLIKDRATFYFSTEEGLGGMVLSGPMTRFIVLTCPAITPIGAAARIHG